MDIWYIHSHSDIKKYFNRIKRPSMVTIGNFDGVHLGHQHLISKLIKQAEYKNATPVVVTFSPHPAQLFKPNSLCLLQLESLKIKSLEEQALAILVIITFTSEFSQLSYQTFIQDYIVDLLHPTALYLGYDFKCGKDQEGTFDAIKTLCCKANIEVYQENALILNEERISSSLIRHYVSQGNLEKANSLLGKPYEIEGIVVQGRQIGRQLGFPTANLLTTIPVCLPNGIYAATCTLQEKIFFAAVSIGFNPTMKGKERTVEAFLLDFSQSIYGEGLRIRFYHRLRDEKKFPSQKELIQQIQIDVQDVIHFFSHFHLKRVY